MINDKIIGAKALHDKKSDELSGVTIVNDSVLMIKLKRPLSPRRLISFFKKHIFEHAYVCRSEGFPRTGIFHPWARWDWGLTHFQSCLRFCAHAFWWNSDKSYCV